jgi:hypothetical protein
MTYRTKRVETEIQRMRFPVDVEDVTAFETGAPLTLKFPITGHKAVLGPNYPFQKPTMTVDGEDMVVYLMRYKIATNSDIECPCCMLQFQDWSPTMTLQDLINDFLRVKQLIDEKKVLP